MVRVCNCTGIAGASTAAVRDWQVPRGLARSSGRITAREQAIKGKERTKRGTSGPWAGCQENVSTGQCSRRQKSFHKRVRGQGSGVERPGRYWRHYCEVEVELQLKGCGPGKALGQCGDRRGATAASGCFLAAQRAEIHAERDGRDEPESWTGVEGGGSIGTAMARAGSRWPRATQPATAAPGPAAEGDSGNS